MRTRLLALGLSLSLFTITEARSDEVGKKPVINTRADVVRVMAELQDHVAELDRLEGEMQRHFQQLGELAQKAAANPAAAQSFNEQYIKLQSQMQAEHRAYSAVTNIMKTKHDTVKNSISNVR
jgi:cytochrome c-type biogenesis protein CcmH/NrfG